LLVSKSKDRGEHSYIASSARGWGFSLGFKEESCKSTFKGRVRVYLHRLGFEIQTKKKMTLNFTHSSAPLKTIEEIQFGMLSPDEIKAMSVCHIEYPETMVSCSAHQRVLICEQTLTLVVGG